MSESTGYTIVNKIIQLDENFVYNDDFVISSNILTMKDKDSFGNYTFAVSIKINNQTVTGMKLNDVTIFPKVSQQGGVSINIISTEAAKLVKAIQLNLAETVKAYNANYTKNPSPDKKKIQPYYSDFDFESIKYKESEETYFNEHNKEKKRYDKGISAQVYLDKTNGTYQNYIKQIGDMNDVKGSTSFITSELPMSKAYLESFKDSPMIKKEKRYCAFYNTYKKTYAELKRMSDDTLSEYKQLVNKESFEESLDKKKAIIISLNFGPITSNFGRKYSSWKLILSNLIVTPRLSSSAEAIDDDEELLMAKCSQVKTQEVHNNNDEIVDEEIVEDTD